jgi:uncharacterized protein
MVGVHPFSLFEFITAPLKTFTFLCLIITTMSFWAYKRLWIWGPLLAFSCVCAHFAHILDVGLIIPIALLFCAHWILCTQLPNIAKLLVVMIIILLSVGFGLHLFPDIHNWLLDDAVQISPSAPSFNYYWNFDKPFIGLFVLGFHLKLINSKEELKTILPKTFTLSILFVAFLLTLSLVLHVVKFDLKLPLLTPAWLIGNLFLTVIPEEAFFRGFLQHQLTLIIPNKAAPFIANFLVSVIFALAHIFFISNPAYIIIAFFASLAYGILYHVTRSIESAIFVHYLLNVMHFIFFSYPLLTA